MRHLDLELLQAALAGDVPVKALMRQLLAHLSELCPECAETVTSLRQAREGRDAGADWAASAVPPLAEERRLAAPEMQVGGEDPRFVGVLDGAFDRAQGDATAWAVRVRRERRKARADVRELLRVPAAARPRKIERAQARYRSRAVAELLLDESRRMVREQPSEARSLAGLVHLVLLWTPGAMERDWARELSILAQAWVANTFRVEYDLRAAERQFAEVRAAMAREMVGEELHAEVASLEASLRVDQGRHEEARRLLDQAAVLFRAQGGRGERLARILIQRALLEDSVGQVAAAVALQREALELLRGQDQPQLFRESLVNLGLFLVNGRREREAAELLGEHETSLRAAGMWDWPHVQSIRGRVAFAVGDLAAAERLFLAAREELVGRHDAVRAAVASLDLAVLYLAQGKTAELRRMARLIGSIFDSAELESEALAAVVLFQKAVAAESVTETAIRAWRRQLEVARMRPAGSPQVS